MNVTDIIAELSEIRRLFDPSFASYQDRKSRCERTATPAQVIKHLERLEAKLAGLVALEKIEKIEFEKGKLRTALSRMLDIQEGLLIQEEQVRVWVLTARKALEETWPNAST